MVGLAAGVRCIVVAVAVVVVVVVVVQNVESRETKGGRAAPRASPNFAHPPFDGIQLDAHGFAAATAAFGSNYELLDRCASLTFPLVSTRFQDTTVGLMIYVEIIERSLCARYVLRWCGPAGADRRHCIQGLNNIQAIPAARALSEVVRSLSHHD